MVRENWKTGNMVGCRVFVMALVMMLVCSVFVVLPVESADKGSKVDYQTILAYMDDADDGTRAYYVNGSSVQGWTRYGTTRTDNGGVLFIPSRGETLTGDTYTWTAATPSYTDGDRLMDNAYPDTSPVAPWTFNSPATTIFENATGYCGWTFTNGGLGGTFECNEPKLRSIPVPAGTFNAGNIDVSWSAMPVYVAGDFSYSPDAGTTVADVNNQFMGYLVYRAAKTGASPVATWNDVASAGSVASGISGWELKGGTEASPLTGTGWTDSSPPTGNYTYSIKLVFNGSLNVSTFWGSLGSDFVEISAPNNAPVLSGGGVTPTSGETTDTFTYNVTYTDADNDAPTSIVVHILKTGSDIAGSPFAMTWESGTNDTGANYRYEKVGLAEGSDYTYYFNATDGEDYAAQYPSPAATGPTVTAPAYQPQQIGISISDTVYTPTTAHPMTADAIWTLYCWGYNNTATPAWYGLVPATTWSVNTIAAGSGTLSDSSGTTTIFNATTVGTCNVSATKTGLSTNYTATITVSAGLFAKIVIYDTVAAAPAWQQDYSNTPSGSTLSFEARGYDSDDNPVGLSECDWTVTGGIGTVLPLTGTATTFTAASTAGSGTVTATNTTTSSITNATGTITVTVAYQPDLLLEGDGNTVYETAATVTDTVQDKTVTLNVGQSKNWTIVLQNDGTQPTDTITVDWVVTPTAGWTGTAQMYNGTTPITLPYVINIATGDFETLYLNVTANGGVGDNCEILVNATSGGTGNPKDCVRTVTSLPAALDAWWIATWECPSPASTELTYTIPVEVYNNYSAGQPFTVTLTITGATTYSDTRTTPSLALYETGWANFTGITFNEGDSVVTVQVTTPPGNPDTKTVTTKAVTIPAAPTTSFAPTVIGIGIAVLVVAILGTMVIWRKKKEKKKTKE